MPSGLEPVREDLVVLLLSDARGAASGEPDVVHGPSRRILEAVAIQAEADLERRHVVGR